MYVLPLDSTLLYHQFVRLAVKLDAQAAPEATQVVAQYVDAEVNTAKIGRELFVKALQLGDQTLTSTLELWQKHPERITSKQLRDFFKMYGEMEKVRQADDVIDLKKKEQEYEQKFKPAGMFANIWFDIFLCATAGDLIYEDMKTINGFMSPFSANLEQKRIAAQEVNS